MKPPKVTLDQWRTLQAVIDYGGFAQASEKLHRSQSSISYAVNRMQELLGISLLHMDGRKALLTNSGKVLLQRSRQLVADASMLEQQAHELEQGWEAEVRLAVEAAYPTRLLMEALKRFELFSKNTRIRLQETVLSGSEDLLLAGDADLVITPYIPQGFLGDRLITVDFIAVAHPDHPLHILNRKITMNDLNRETHVTISDSGSKGINSGWLSDTHRWTVNSIESARKIISNGLGYGWLPKQEIEPYIDQGILKPLPLKEGLFRPGSLFLVIANTDLAGPATRKLAELLMQVSAESS